MTGIPDEAADGWAQFEADAADWLLGLLRDHQMPLAAAAALERGCRSGALTALAKMSNADQSKILPLVFETCCERGVEFPLSTDAIKQSTDRTLARIVAGELSPEAGSVKLWSLADIAAHGPAIDELQEFRELAITLDVSEYPENGLDLDLALWRQQMVSLAREVLGRGGVSIADDITYAPNPDVEV